MATTTCQAELVVNGGFETGGFFPWMAPPNVPLGQPNPQYFNVVAGGGHSGMYYAELASSQLRYISQVLPTTAGSDYELSFWLRRTSFASAFLVRWEGQQVFGEFLTNPDFMEWKHFTVPLHSNITGSLLEFGQDYFPQEFHIDDISVLAVPAPSAAPLLIVGGAIALGRRRR